MCFTLLCNICICALPARAADILPEKLLAVSNSQINENTIRKTQTVSLYALDDYFLFDDNLNIKKGEKLVFILNSYNPPTRGKRNGAYKVTLKSPQPKESGYVLSGTMHVATPKDLKGMAKNLGISAAGKILKVPGFSQAIAAAKGIINPDEEVGRLKTVEKNVYESTPLSYAEKGKDFVVEPDGVVVIKLRNEI